MKSVIDRSKRQKDTITALGIKKLHNPVVKEVNPQIMGMVAKVRHLITVEEC
ncbi:MAG: 50S ribosomal protein L30 [Saprospiraceae bacterium]